MSNTQHNLRRSDEELHTNEMERDVYLSQKSTNVHTEHHKTRDAPSTGFSDKRLKRASDTKETPKIFIAIGTHRDDKEARRQPETFVKTRIDYRTHTNESQTIELNTA